MPTTRPYIYIDWFRGAIVEAGTVATAKTMVLARYPDAFFSDWEDALQSVNMRVWANPVKRLRFDFGERDDESKPVAYILMQDRPLPLSAVEAERTK